MKKLRRLRLFTRKHLRQLARWYLLRSWRATLSYGERLRLDYWGATGNPDHHLFECVDYDMPPMRGRVTDG